MNVRRCKDGSFRSRIYHLHTDQIATIELGLKAARSELNTDYDSVALDAICMNYLSGGNVAEQWSLDSVLQKHSLEDVLMAMKKAFPEVMIATETNSTK
ncbi:MAG: hypothetical protein WB646_19780 [Steroidobacteraceae bacterium]